ncbi:MAG: DoxX family protein [Piscirickettsiaceae bacterium]|nr:DoxX family protein [Piscirickettsiaceae bacterium]
MSLCNVTSTFQSWLNQTRLADFLAPLALRLYLAPIFWMAANNKWNPFDSDSSLQGTIDWFANPDWGLGLPFPEIMAYLAWATEYFGAILLLTGLAVRWISIPLMTTMIVAAVTVHWGNGWLAIAEPSAQLDAARSLLEEHGNYDWLTQNGSFVVLNNGIEFATTYFIMLMTLFFIGAGNYVSADYWIAKKFSNC